MPGQSFGWFTNVAGQAIRRFNTSLLCKLLARVHCQVNEDWYTFW